MWQASLIHGAVPQRFSHKLLRLQSVHQQPVKLHSALLHWMSLQALAVTGDAQTVNE